MSNRATLAEELREKLTRDAVYEFASKVTTRPELYVDDEVPVSPRSVVDWLVENLDNMPDEIRDYIDLEDN